MFLGISLFSLPAFCAPINGADLSLAWGLPFAMILLSLALCPLIIPDIWHAHYGKIANGFGLLFILPFLSVFGVDATKHLWRKRFCMNIFHLWPSFLLFSPFPEAFGLWGPLKEILLLMCFFWGLEHVWPALLEQREPLCC